MIDIFYLALDWLSSHHTVQFTQFVIDVKEKFMTHNWLSAIQFILESHYFCALSGIFFSQPMRTEH